MTTPVRFSRPDHHGLLLGLRAPQLAVLSFAAAVAVLVLLSAPNTAGLAAAGLVLSLTAVCVSVRPGGRPLDGWASIALRWYAGGARTWRGAPPAVDPPPPLAGIKILNVTYTGHPTPIAIVQDTRHGRLTAVLHLTGGALTLTDPDQAQQHLDRWGATLDSLGSVRNVRLTWLHQSGPASLAEVAPDLDEADPTDPIWQAYSELVTTLKPNARTHRSHLALTVDRNREPLSTAAERLIDLTLDLVLRLGAAGLHAETVLARPAVVELFARAFDPESESTVYPWPAATQRRWASYRTDDTEHATFWLADWPRVAVAGGFLDELLTHPPEGVTVRFALLAAPVGAGTSMRRIRAARAGHVADDELRAQGGMLNSMQRQQDCEDLVRHEQQLAAGHVEFRHRAHLTVTAGTEDTLEQACRALTARAGTAHLRLTRCHGEQAETFTYTLPVGRGLD